MLSDKELELLNKIQKRSIYEDKFFEKRSELKWFYELQKRGYFYPNPDTRPRESKEKGLFTIPQWNVLPYLEKVSRQVNEPENEKYIDELLGIIKDVSTYRDEKGNHIDNYRTWWYFVKILINIPPEKIPSDIIDLIPIWLDSKFDTSLPGADILNKLLPGFLREEATEESIAKAEKIIEYTTALKFLPEEKDTEFGDRSNKYRTVIESYWLKEAFEKYSGLIGERCSCQVIYDLAAKIKPLLVRKESQIPISVDGRTYLLVLNEDEKNYIVTILIAGDQSATDMVGEVLSGQEVKGDIVSSTRIDKQSNIDFVNKMVKAILFKEFEEKESLKSFTSDVFDLHFRKLFNSFHDRGTYQSFYDAQEYFDRDPLALLTFITKRVFVAKATSSLQNNIDETRSVIGSFFEERYLFFTKMALYIIGHDVGRYGDLFWDALERDSEDFILNDFSFGDELKHLLRNLGTLSDHQRELLKRKIDSTTRARESKEVSREYLASVTQQWYEALSFDPEFKRLYEEMKEITQRDEELGPAVGPVITRHGPGPSALQKDDFLHKTNQEIAEFFATFKQQDTWNGPTERGLAEVFKQAVQERPEKFIDDAKHFLNSGYLYAYYMLLGVKDAWANKKGFDWQRLFDFIRDYIGREDFWKDKLPLVGERGWQPDHETVIGEISELIKEGTRDDSNAFPEAVIEDARQLLWLIIDRLAYVSEKEEGFDDYVTHALNSPWGKTILAFVYLVLRIVRMNDKKGQTEEIKWDEGFRAKYNDFLDKNIIEAYTWLGNYLPQFYYIDKKWATKKIKDLDPAKEKQAWEAFMNGYLYGGRVFDDIFELMRPHYENSLQYDFKESRDKERLVQHIAIGYLRRKERLDDSNSLFRRILDAWDHVQVREIISFFWMQRDYATSDNDDARGIRKQILEFWKTVYRRYQFKDAEELDKNDKLLLSKLSKLTVFLYEIDDDNFQWLLQVALYAKEDFSSPFFIEYLDRLKNSGDKAKTAGYIGTVFLTMLDHFTPDYDEAHIRSIIEFIYQAGLKEKAKTICNIYGSRGHEFLRDIYEKYNREDGK